MFSVRSQVVRRCIAANTAKCTRRGLSQYTQGFQGLIQDISTLLAPYSGLDAAEIDHKALQHRLQAYSSNPAEWNRYAFTDVSLNYTRNLVDRGNGKANLVSQ